MAVPEQILAVFLAAHMAGDFLLQTRRDVENKEQPAVLLRHGGIHGLLILAFAGTWTVALPALAVAITHAAIDYAKRRLTSGGWRAFLIDQALHLLILGSAALLYWRSDLAWGSIWSRYFGDLPFQVFAVLAGLIATVSAGAYFIDLAVKSFLAQIHAAAGPVQDTDSGPEAVERAAGARLRGLRDGGRTIGQLERALIFVFILLNQLTAIGFLITAKFVFRFGELRDRSNRMEAEYIIIGTLISFLWAIVAAMLTRMLAGL